MSKSDYKCEHCSSKHPRGHYVKCVFTGSNALCDRCRKLMPHESQVVRTVNSYYHKECYEFRIDPTTIMKNPDPLPSEKEEDDEEELTTKSGKPLRKSIFDFMSRGGKNKGPKSNHEPISPGLEDVEKINSVDWPNTNVIDSTFENLDKNIDDFHDLKNFEVVKDMMDLPLSYPGAFARVYKVKQDNKFFALRFFTKKKDDAMNRYRILHEFYELNKQNNQLPFLTDFQYLSNSIKIKVKDELIRFPIVKMDWVDGQTLEIFFQSKPSKNKIKSVRKNFLDLISTMESLNIAHGDLHPKNIIIDNQKNLKLVDYDCMFIEKFKNSNMPELGDPDCQHPNRENFAYDEKIDRFSSIVLYLTMLILEEKPDVINIRNGEFIFSSNDYSNSTDSKIFQICKELTPEIQNLSDTLIQICKSRKPKIPALGELVKQ